MASSSLSQKRTEQHKAFSGIEPQGIRRKVEESSRLFDVFINHRGPDVKQTVALHLYNSLTELGINTFLDSEEKELGDSFPSTIENAIHSASAHIAIFSKGYAESPWCLAELVLMLQSRAKIIPLFYGVEPSALRYIEKGKYAKAFTKYEENRRYMEKLKGWKEALQSVSFITGYEISSNFKISDCQNIVSAVQKEVQTKISLHVAKYPVGLHRLVKDFERLCLDTLVEDFERQCGATEADKEKAKIVGIFGMGGVGKTTLAKELFNRKQSQYKRTCFLFDVREAYANKSFHSLQLTLLKDLFRRDKFNFHCTEEGTGCIADCIKRSNHFSFLLVLDDIDHVQQLDALLINDMLKNSFDSLVIVTTRDAGVLINTGITVAYNLKGMDGDYARELFCWHAFGQPHPARDYENMVESFLNVCGGLPLSLQVLGSHVHGRDQNFWRLELNKVRKTLPQDIRQRLGISIDALDAEEQHILMDLACFFVDKSKSIAMEVWEASGCSAQHALERLKNKCLVQEIERLPRVGEDRFALRMHAHLQDLGREMADRLSPPWLWRPRDLECLESNGFQNILDQAKGRCFHSFRDKSMNCLITYFLGESDASADTSTILLWLKLEFECELNKNFNTFQPSIPSWIPLQNLRCLIIWNMIFETVWQIHLQEFTQLKELQLCNSVLEEFSDLSGISNTSEKFLIHNCTGLITVSGLSDLKYLIELNISKCPDLQKLSVVHLSCLEKIVLHNCNRLKTVSGISDLKKLVELDISGWPVFEQLRLVSLNNLKRITVNYLSESACFELDDCRSLETISGGSGFGNLVSINIRNCPRLEGLPFIQGLRDLKTVTIDGCGKLKGLLFSKCQNLERVTFKLGLTCLEEITIQDCGKLSCLELFKCISLKKVSISGCCKLERLPCFARQTCLEKICIVRCEKLQNICLPTKLVELGIEGCRELKTVTQCCDHSERLELQELSGVARLTCLKWIKVKNCDKLQTIQSIAELGVLEILHLFNCPELEELPYFSRQTCLEEITIIRCEKLQNITLPTTLVKLIIEGWRELKTVTMICYHSERLKLQNFSNIVQQITIHNCDKLQAVQGIGELRSLGTLQLSNCSELEELPCFAHQTCLEEITIVKCGKLKTITLPTTLVVLTIENCRELKTVAVICDHGERLKLQDFSSAIQQITIQNCDKLQTVQGIDGLHALGILQLGQLSSV